MPDEGLSDSTYLDDFLRTPRNTTNNNNNDDDDDDEYNNNDDNNDNDNDVKKATTQILMTADVEDDCESDDRTLVDDLVMIL
jgi:hypothetical protein